MVAALESVCRRTRSCKVPHGKEITSASPSALRWAPAIADIRSKEPPSTRCMTKQHPPSSFWTKALLGVQLPVAWFLYTTHAYRCQEVSLSGVCVTEWGLSVFCEKCEKLRCSFVYGRLQWAYFLGKAHVPLSFVMSRCSIWARKSPAFVSVVSENPQI